MAPEPAAQMLPRPGRLTYCHAWRTLRPWRVVDDAGSHLFKMTRGATKGKAPNIARRVGFLRTHSEHGLEKSPMGWEAVQCICEKTRIIGNGRRRRPGTWRRKCRARSESVMLEIPKYYEQCASEARTTAELLVRQVPIDMYEMVVSHAAPTLTLPPYRARPPNALGSAYGSAAIRFATLTMRAACAAVHATPPRLIASSSSATQGTFAQRF